MGAQLGVVHLQLLHLAGRHGVWVNFGLSGDGVGNDHQDDPTHQKHQGEDEAIVCGVVVSWVELSEVLAVLLPSTSFLLIVRPRRELLMLLLALKKRSKEGKDKDKREQDINKKKTNVDEDIEENDQA